MTCPIISIEGGTRQFMQFALPYGYHFDERYMAKVISDRLPKRKCREWLESVGFTEVRLAKSESCDLVAKKDGKSYFIEIKYSSKQNGIFFGTVMLTEMFKAINNKDSYLFLICRGASEKTTDWFFRLFRVDEFIRYCTLTTPIFLYRMDISNENRIATQNYREKTTIASEDLIRLMWENFQNWKFKPLT